MKAAIRTRRSAPPSPQADAAADAAAAANSAVQMELRLALEHGVARVLDESESIEEATPRIIRAICEPLGWVCGARWHPEGPEQALRCAETWGVPGDELDAFLEATRRLPPSLQPGGLHRRTWVERRPLWILDVTREPSFRRAADAAKAGLRSAFAVPIKSGAQVIGVMEFFSQEMHQPDPELLDCMTYVGSQIGQFMQRKQAERVLRDSEERFRSLAELSSDLYWTQDSQHRFTSFSGSNTTLPQRLIGKHRWDEGALNMTEADWAAHRAVMDAHQPFRDLELARVNGDGEVFWISISGAPVLDEAGGFAGYRGISRNITARKREEMLLNLEHAVTRCVAEAESVAQALKPVIRSICETQSWECGRYFGIDEKAALLRFVDAWGVEHPSIERFIDASKALTYACGVGLVGQVWQSGEVLWTEDIATDSRARKGIARECGLHGAFMFPVRSGAEPLGVLVFHSRRVRKPDARLLQAVRIIGSQIGQFLKRKQAELEMRASEERFRSLTELSSDWYWEQDDNFRFTRMSSAAGGSRERGPASSIGQRRWDLPALNMTEADWEAHRAVLEAHQPFRDLELHRLTADGRLRYTSVSGEPVFGSCGRFKGYRGVGKDITVRKRAEQLRALEHAVSRRIAESENASAGLKAAIRAVCEAEGWECGRYFVVDEHAGLLRFAEAWSKGGEAAERFIAASRDRVYRPGNGLSGRAWQSAQALWSADATTDPRSSSGASPRGPTTDMGMHASFVFPVLADGKVIGVLSFASREAREPEPQLLEAIHAIGSQIGQFLKRKRAEEVMRESEERFRGLTELSSDLYWEQDEEFRFTSFTGIGSQRISVKSLPYIGKKRWEQNYANMSAEDWRSHIELLHAHRPFRDLELCRLDESGRKVWISVSGEPVFGAEGRFRGYRGVGKDITERKLNEERIQYLANHDALTGLPNRAMFTEVLNHSIQGARRYNRSFAVLFVDLDRFKVINDTLGHEAGDMLLKEVSRRLTATVRASDFVARLGGDEFVVMVQEVTETKQVEAVARKILAACARPLVIQAQEYRVTASIGVCMYPADADDEQALMKNADIAMYRAKEEGKNTCKFYSAEANIHSFERLALETALRRGLERNEFFLHYQAKLDLATGNITGVEALVRWQHPDLGAVSPAQFIPLAEETGLIVPLGKWVLKTACAQNVAWQREGLPALRMAVNISAREFADEDLLDDIQSALAESGMKPELLELELTESMVMQNPERASGILASLKRLGVRLAIDDFGVGYSSLAHLKRFPIDTLKVDRSFIRDIPQDSEDKAITEAIIAMGKSLDLTVVAEGVETLEQQTFLREHDCDEMQGFYFSKPIASGEFAELLRRRLAN